MLQALTLRRSPAESPDLVQHLGGFTAGKPGWEGEWAGLCCPASPRRHDASSLLPPNGSSGTKKARALMLFFPPDGITSPTSAPAPPEAGAVPARVSTAASQPAPAPLCPPLGAPRLPGEGCLSKGLLVSRGCWISVLKIPHWEPMRHLAWTLLCGQGELNRSVSEWWQFVQLCSHEADTEMQGHGESTS